MSLLEAMLEPFVIVNKTKVSDGEGGFITTWEDGDEFLGVATLDTTMQARIAEKQGVTSVYTITTGKNVVLDYQDVIKCIRTGRIYRVTSDGGEKVTPSVSNLDMSQVTAEKWELTK